MDAPAKRRLIRELLSRVAGCGPILHIGLDSQNNQVILIHSFMLMVECRWLV